MENFEKEYNALCEKDVDNLWRIHVFFQSHPRLQSFMSSIVSKHPWYDVCAIIWIIVIIGCIEIGSKHFWVVTINVFASFIARGLIQAKRPVEYDIKLQPLCDLGDESFGFPSLESYMSIVIIGHFFVTFSNNIIFIVLWIPTSTAIVAVVGISRLYAKSRFPHQVLGSWVLGIVGLLSAVSICDNWGIHL